MKKTRAWLSQPSKPSRRWQVITVMVVSTAVQHLRAKAAADLEKRVAALELTASVDAAIREAKDAARRAEDIARRDRRDAELRRDR